MINVRKGQFSYIHQNIAELLYQNSHSEGGKRENKVEISKKPTTFPEGLLVLGDVKSITEFIRGMNATVS